MKIGVLFLPMSSRKYRVHKYETWLPERPTKKTKKRNKVEQEETKWLKEQRKKRLEDF
jgi:hypothetical protein